MKLTGKKLLIGAAAVAFLTAKAAFAQQAPTKIIHEDTNGGRWTPGSYIAQLELNPDGVTGYVYMYGVSAKGLEFEELCPVCANQGLDSNVLTPNPNGTVTSFSRDSEDLRFVGVFQEGPDGTQKALRAEAPRIDGRPRFLHNNGSFTVQDVTDAAKADGRPFYNLHKSCSNIVASVNKILQGQHLRDLGRRLMGKPAPGVQ